MRINKSLFLFFVLIKTFFSKSFYDEINLDFEYNFSCNEDCNIHTLIDEFYTKISKIWFVLDCFQSVQTGIAENEDIFFEIISDLLKSFKIFDEKNISKEEFLKHKDDIKTLKEIVKILSIHPVVEKNEILFIIIDLTESNLNINENN